MVYLKPVSNNKRNRNNKFYINLCSNCTESIKNKNKIPELYIANGVDFGDYTRIGLTKLSVIENCLISRLRLYIQVIKIESVYCNKNQQ